MNHPADSAASDHASPSATPWRGKRQTHSQTPRRGWQQGGTVQPLTKLRLQNQWRRFRIALLLLALLLLFAAWMYALLFKAVETPFVAVTAIDYQWPIPPNAWAAEDLDRFKDLDDKTLAVVEASPDWSSGASGLQDFEKKLSGIIKRRRNVPAVIVYVSMHGVVDGAGEPCLVPPGASPLDSSKWVRVSYLLDRIKTRNLPDELDKLLILDSSRMQTNWGLGVLYNSFAERLPQVVKAADVPNLVVLNSAGPGQVGWSSPELQGSVFGHFLRSALAGEGDADRDANGRLTIGELYDYLLVRVNAWAMGARSARQEPMLIVDNDDARGRHIAWVPDAEVPRPRPDPKDAVARDNQRKLWAEHERMLEFDPYRFAPAEFQHFRHRLLWLEQLAGAGRAYSKRADEVYRELLRDVQRWTVAVEGLKGALPDPRAVPSHYAVWSNDGFEGAGDGLVPHTLPLATFFGTIDDSLVGELGGQIAGFRAEPNQSVLSKMLAAHARLADDNDLPSLMETTFLRQLQRLDVDAGQPPAAEGAEMRSQALRSVLDAVMLGEEVAVPGDERAAHWLRASVEQSDLYRRAAEDALADGDFEDATSAAQRADQARRLVRLNTASVASAFALRDRAWAVVPYLAQWLTAPPLPGTPAEPLAAAEAPRLAKLIDNLHLLGEQLDDLDSAVAFLPTDPLPFDAAESEVAENLNALEKRFQEYVAALTQVRRPTAETLKKAQRVLATPLLSPDQRGDLLEIVDQVCATHDLSKDGQMGTPAPAGESSEDAARSSGWTGDSLAEQASSNPEVLLDYLASKWPEHPAVQLLSPPWYRMSAADRLPDDTAATESSDSAVAEGTQGGSRLEPAERLDREGGLIRQRLLALAKHVENPSSLASDGLTDQRPDEDAPIETTAGMLRVRSRSERLVRATLAVWPQRLDVDPIAQRRRFDLQHLVRWHCQRTLDDFRGPASVGEEPFFQIAASDYVDWLRRDAGADTAMAWQVKSVSEKMDAYRELARQPLQVVAESVLLVDSADPVETQVLVQPDAAQIASGLPPGRLGLFVRGEHGRIDGARFIVSSPADNGSSAGLPFPLSDPCEAKLVGARLGGLGPKLDVVCTFRGHTFIAPLLIQTIGGVTVDFHPRTDRTTRVVLKGTRRQRKSFVFILDCSDSMEEITVVEATDGRQTQRMNVAKEALQGMLDQLAAQRGARVGVRFFGHRVGWSTAEPVRILRQSDYAREIPLDLSPSEDVELVLPLGRFDSVTAGQVADLLQTVRAWGQTPLYRSLVEAMGDFDRDDPDTEKHIVVITDGANYQFTPSASGQFSPPRPTEMDDVVSAWGRHKPAIHIVGFGIPDSEVAEAQREYQELVDRTKGNYETTAAEAGVLLRRLDELMGRATYTVRDERGDDVGAHLERDGTPSDRVGPARLGEPLIVLPTPVDRRTYTLACQEVQALIPLRGGESAVLELNEEDRRIESIAYLDDAPKFHNLFDDALGTESEYVAGVHRAVADNEGIPFTVSIQHQARRFSPRPAEVWIEVTPVLDGQRRVSPSYIFYDAEFVEGTPVPVLRWLAKDWPDAATKARVRCWCKQEQTEPEVVVALNRISPAPVEPTDYREFPGVELQIETVNHPSGFGVRVVEWHSEESEGVGSLKVDLVGPAGYEMRAKRIIRTFDAEHFAAAHVFYLPNLDLLGDAGWEIQITKASSVKANSLQLSKPIEVTVAETLDLLPPLPATEVP